MGSVRAAGVPRHEAQRNGHEALFGGTPAPQVTSGTSALRALPR